MKILCSENLDLETLSPELRHYAYNGMDCMITREVWDELAPKAQDSFAYNMSRTMQAPSFALQQRGVKIDMQARSDLIVELRAQRQRLEYIFRRFAKVWEFEVNEKTINSPKQLLFLFYDILMLKPVLVYNKLTKEREPSTNRESLEKLSVEPRAKPFTSCILEIRDIDKKLGVLLSGMREGRMHCSYHVAGTLTGRWSSTSDPFGSGTNLQNISDEMRRMFIADEGFKLCQLDLAQAESKVVAYLCLPWGDNYLKACISSDLHTLTCKLVWPELPWGEGNAREIAERKYYREFSYRDLAKRGGHGSNYGGQAKTLAMHLKIPVAVAEEFQRKYFAAFPEILKWHNSIRTRLVIERAIKTPLGRVCHFPGRPWDSDTIKSAIAYAPQSTIGDVLNLGFLKLWKKFEVEGKLIQVLTQVHDSILFQYRERDEGWLIPLLQKEIVIPIDINGKRCEIVSDAKVGWNWGKRIEEKKPDGSRIIKNGWGLTDYKGSDARRAPEKIPLLGK